MVSCIQRSAKKIKQSSKSRGRTTFVRSQSRHLADRLRGDRCQTAELMLIYLTPFGRSILGPPLSTSHGTSDARCNPPARDDILVKNGVSQHHPSFARISQMFAPLYPISPPECSPWISLFRPAVRALFPLSAPRNEIYLVRALVPAAQGLSI